jgi:uncharacterized repeat protein (TIGR03803 family)
MELELVQGIKMKPRPDLSSIPVPNHGASPHEMKEPVSGGKPCLTPLKVLLWAVAFLMPAFGSPAGVSFITLYSFTDKKDGANPVAALVRGRDGSFYGTTQFGGNFNASAYSYPYGCGTVFRIRKNGMLETLHAFGTVTNEYGGGPLDGQQPCTPLVQGKDGCFYGTTRGLFGVGPNISGTVFKISPNGMLTTLYSFTGGSDGANPQGGMVQGSDGSFYGTTLFGGKYGAGVYGSGTVFKISPTGVLTTLYSFSGGTDGALPNGVVHGDDDCFYGTTGLGGKYGSRTYGSGTIFRISTNGTLTSLYSFTGANDGWYPNAGLVEGRDGSFYGTTIGGGTNGGGTVFKISTNGTLTSLFSFASGTEVSQPEAGLMQGSDGNFYGTTFGYVGFSSTLLGADGNIDIPPTTYGAVFQITTNGVLTSLFSFTGGADGGHPEASLVQGSDGNIYGTTSIGGKGSAGTIFRFTVSPPAPRLEMTVSGTNVVLSWPANAIGFYLQGSKNPEMEREWTRVDISTPPVILNGQFVVTLPIPASQKLFYRLSSDDRLENNLRAPVSSAKFQ